MKKIPLLIAACTLLALSVSSVNSAATVGNRVNDFELTDLNGLAHHLYYYSYAPAIVLSSRNTTVPTAANTSNVVFFQINPNNTPAGGGGTVLVDTNQLVSNALSLNKEGEVLVINPKTWNIVYRGPADSAYWNALNKLVSNVQLTPVSISVTGKTIPLQPLPTNISYSKDIAPILQAKCVTCHQEGAIGPFKLNSYDVVKGYAPMIREVIMTRRMPPWFADPAIGHWSNDTSLTPTEIKTLVSWINTGAPRGTGDDILKTQASSAPEWPVALGKPDVIVNLPAFSVPATGVIEYQNMVVDNPFKTDAWLRAVVFKPSGRPVLHHITSSYSADRSLPPAAIPGSSVGSYVPGAGVQSYNAGTGAPVPVGGKLRFSMHYTTVGKAMTDQTQIGYYLLKAPPEIIRRAAIISDPGLRIPAGDARHKEISYLEFPADAVLYSVHPHAHYRGYSVKLTQITPDGKESTILSVPRYDFNWQLDYDLAQPLTVKAGTKLRVTFIYDNSEHNKANPDPKLNVTWGEQTFNEMMYFRINYRFVDETSSHIRNDLQNALMATRTMGVLDDNADGKLSMSELIGSSGSSLKTRFTSLDRNNDGFLDKDELKAGSTNTNAQLAATDNDL